MQKAFLLLHLRVFFNRHVNIMTNINYERLPGILNA